MDLTTARRGMSKHTLISDRVPDRQLQAEAQGHDDERPSSRITSANSLTELAEFKRHGLIL